MKKLLCFICLGLFFASCNDKDEPDPTPTPDPKADRTVIVYMSAENNLSLFAGRDITEITLGSKTLSEDNNLIVYVDRAKESGMEVGEELPTILKIEAGKSTVIKRYDTDFISSDPEKMTEVLELIARDYPAKSYGLVLWSHSQGWCIENDSVAVASNSNLRRAFGRDTGNNTADAQNNGKWINIPTLAKVLEHLSFRFNYIFADCCNMSNAETAYELRKATDYLVASPAEIPANGAPYDKLLPYLFSNDIPQAYNSIVDTYADSYRNKMPLVVIQMNQMEQLANATSVILSTLEPTADKDFKLYRNANGLMYYDGLNTERVCVLYDMNDFLLQNATTDNYNQWKLSFDRAVTYKRYASEWTSNGHVLFTLFKPSQEKFGGMSMYIPQTFYNASSYSRNYNATYPQMQWYWAIGWNKYGW